MQQPLNDPNPTPFIGVASNKLTRDGEGITQGVIGSTEETLKTISPSQQHGRTDWAYPYQPGTAPAPTLYADAGMTFSSRSSIPTISCGSMSSSGATFLPSTSRSPKRSDHGVIRSSSQRRNTQELNPCAEYVAPSKGPMLGGVEVTIVGTNFPHTLPLSVYFGTKLAYVVSREYLVRGQLINADSKTRKTQETIRCLVPPTSSPGITDVRIMVEHPESVPEIDCRMAQFTYEDKRMTE